VLYGIDHAKREMAKQGRAVIVEGYTDVMACHEAGEPTAVATCGTAFGDRPHRRAAAAADGLDSFTGEIIYTFDGDAAGQKAALRAFEEDQRFVGRTFIAVSPDNMDPCELRLAKGDLAVRDMIASREPLVDFALRQTLSRFDLDTVEGRVEAMRRAAPLVAKIKDREKRPEYARKLAGDLGMDLEPVQRAVAARRRSSRRSATARRPAGQPAAAGRARGAEAGPAVSGAGRADVRRARPGELRRPGVPGDPRGDRGRRRHGHGHRRRGAGSRRSGTPATTWAARRWSASWRWSRCTSTARRIRGTCR
jgi:DNA primase